MRAKVNGNNAILKINQLNLSKFVNGLEVKVTHHLMLRQFFFSLFYFKTWNTMLLSLGVLFLIK